MQHRRSTVDCVVAPKNSTGYTLVELLVVLSIIGILLGLLLPAVQAAREASRRASCESKLHQLGVATQQYVNVHRSFPPGAAMHAKAGKTGISWRVMILPYMEESSIYEQTHPTADGGATSMAGQRLTIASYLCPSAAPAPEGENDFKQSNYAGVTGPGRYNARFILADKDCGDVYTDGLFFPGSRTTIAKIEDGTSHTFAIGEQSYPYDNWLVGAVWQGNPYTLICSYAASNIRYPLNSKKEQLGYYFADNEAPDPALQKISVNDLWFGSNHPGGAQFCFADGSVHVIEETIDFEVYCDLATIAGSEPSRWP